MFWLVLSILVLTASVIFAFWSIRKEVELSKSLGEKHPEPGPHPIIPTQDNSLPTKDAPQVSNTAFRLEEGPRRQAEHIPPTPQPTATQASNMPQPAKSFPQALPVTQEYQEASGLISSRNEKKDQLRGQIDLQKDHS
mgnify:CR=1 FL=1